MTSSPKRAAMMAAMLFIATPMAAHAQTARVAVDHAALTDASAVEALYERLEHVAETVCERAYRATGSDIGRARRQAIEACTEETLEQAVARSGVAALETLHVERSAPEQAAVRIARAE